MKTPRQIKIEVARQFRKRPTPAEKLLWNKLRNRNVLSTRFRRQHPLKGFILDFYCPEYHLGIEVDGKIHDTQQDYDQLRHCAIEQQGIRLLRFSDKAMVGEV